MTTIRPLPIHVAKAQLSRLIDRACAGEPVIIARGRRPLVKLVPIEPIVGRQFGAMKGKAKVARAFFEPLADVELAAWEQ